MPNPTTPKPAAAKPATANKATLTLGTMNALRFTRMVNFTNLPTINVPQLAQDQSDLLHRDPTAVVHTIDQKQWVTLVGWLDPEHAVLQCRRSGFSVKVNRKDKVTAGLLPLADGFPKASLVYTVSKSSPPQQKKEKLETNLDTNSGTLVMALNFGKNGDLYDEVFAAMSSQPSDIAVQIEYSHTYQVQVQSTTPARPPAQPPARPPAQPPRTPPPAIRTTTKPRVSPYRMATPVAMAKAVPAQPAPVKPAARPAAAAFAYPIAMSAARMNRVDTRRIVVAPPPPPPNTTTTFRNETLAGQPISIPAAHSPTDPDGASVFPDYIRQTKSGGWGQLNVEHRVLHYVDAPQSDTFYYLPTTFKLGCYSDPNAGPEASRLPLRVELYSDKDKAERIKATLVALPCIEDSERQALRDHLCRDVLLGQQPFVKLQLKSGLKAKFTGDFSAGTPTGQQSMPADVAFQPTEVSPDENLVLCFDMPATSYSIFCEIMKFGIFGKVQVADTEKGMESFIDVRLQLQDLVTNQLMIEHTPPAPPTDKPAPAGSTPPPTAGSLKLQNLLDFPVQVSSLNVTYLDVGKSSRQIFASETVSLPLSGKQLPAKSDPASTANFATQPQQLPVWDETIVETGQLKVFGGTPDDWLTRVNRDPSLQAHTYNLQLQLVVSSGIRDKVQLVRLNLFRAGDPKVRASLELLPNSPPPMLKVTMTMEELMGAKAKAADFYVEYETVSVDGKTSLPQRVAISPDMTSLVVQAVVETPKSIFTVEFQQPDGLTRQELDRAAMQELIDQLRLDGTCWRFSVREPDADSSSSTTTTPTMPDTPGKTSTTAPTATTTTTTPPTTTTAPPATGPEVTIVTDLAALAFQDGSLSRAFVVLKPAGDGPGQQSSFVLGRNTSGALTWKPQGFTVPPFRYEITYLYSNNQVRQSSGTSSDLTLILDPPKLT